MNSVKCLMVAVPADVILDAKAVVLDKGTSSSSTGQAFGIKIGKCRAIAFFLSSLMRFRDEALPEC